MKDTLNLNPIQKKSYRRMIIKPRIEKKNGILFRKINIKRQAINSYSLCNTFNKEVCKIVTYYIKKIYLINKNKITMN